MGPQAGASDEMHDMRMGLQFLWVMVVAMTAFAAHGVVVQDFSRYEIILTRRPFGEAPPESELNPPAAVVPAGPSFVDSLQMCAITSGGGAVRVGFVDAKTQPPKTYFLFVGESEDGIQVIEADYEAETVLLKKDGEERRLRMTGLAPEPYGGVVVTAPAGRPSGSRRSRSRTVIPKSTLTRERYEEERDLGLRGAPTAPRQMLRASPDMGEMPPEVRELAMRKYNMELIRAGGEKGIPLPIKLTPEEDAQLVAEGALPPAAE